MYIKKVEGQKLEALERRLKEWFRVYQEVEGQKQRKDNQSGKQRVLNISESRRSETNGYSSKSSAMVQCTSESRTTETPSLACDITRTVSIHIRK